MMKFFTSDLRRNLIKILCLSVGLAVGILLVAKIYFEQTYDSFLPDIDRLYRLTESVVEQGEYKEFDGTPGGTVHELERVIPEIEAATRFTHVAWSAVIKLEDGRKFDVPTVTLADTCIFDVLKTPVVEGDPHEVLDVENQAMIPLSLARKIGGDVIGKRFSIVEMGDDYKVTIGGVYEDFPLNSTLKNAAYVSMPSVGTFIWKGSEENLIGNDCYRSYVRLAEGSDAETINPKMVDHLKTKLPEEAFAIGDYKVWLRPLAHSHSSLSGVRTMTWMLGILAFIILICASLNYLLIVIGQLSSRAKEMAIRKCYGTDRRRIFVMVMGESLFFLLISLVLAVLLSFSFSDLCTELLGYSPGVLFSIGKVWLVEGFVCLVILIVTGVIPSVIYSNTPVAFAFRASAVGKKNWKLVLLAVQFFATGMVMCMLVLVGRQYKMVGSMQIGLDYENVGWFYHYPLSDEKTATIIEELKKLPFVEGVATADRNPADFAYGNNMWTDGQEENQINIGDCGAVNPDFFDVMGIPFVQGGTFSANTDSTVNEIIVDERMIDVLQNIFGETESDIIGKRIVVTGHPMTETDFPIFTIVGVVGEIRRGGFEYNDVDMRAGSFFPSASPRGNVYVRFSQLTPERLSAAQKVIDSLNDDEAIYITPYKAQIEAKKAGIRTFGTAVLIVGIAIVLIALVGLIGYVTDEVNRRAKEIAIRKVNGTPASKIVRLFCLDVMKVAVPSLLAGGAGAMIAGQKWLSQFTERVSLSPLVMMLTLLLILTLIMLVVIANTLRVARSNPIVHLRSE
ncbi:MAG: ABC transporter permease [Muribaculaceae bacterium]|nr:ABC transporter permease [Muribaculaceae bacterium]